MPIFTKTASGWEEITPSQDLPGVGGWATIGAVESPTIDVPAYTDASGLTWKAWVWKNPRVLVSNATGSAAAPTRDLIGSVTLAEDGLIEVLVCAGGGSGYGSAGAGGGGGVIATVVYLPAGQKDVYVGSGSGDTSPGGGSSVGAVGIGGGLYRSPGDSGGGFSGYSNTTPGGGAAGSAYLDGGVVKPGPGFSLNWADGSTVVEYGAGGIEQNIVNQQPDDPGTGGYYWSGATSYNPGANGMVIVRIPVEYADDVTVTSMSAEHQARVEEESEQQAARAMEESDE